MQRRASNRAVMLSLACVVSRKNHAACLEFWAARSFKVALIICANSEKHVRTCSGRCSLQALCTAQSM